MKFFTAETALTKTPLQAAALTKTTLQGAKAAEKPTKGFPLEVVDALKNSLFRLGERVKPATKFGPDNVAAFDLIKRLAANADVANVNADEKDATAPGLSKVG